MTRIDGNPETGIYVMTVWSTWQAICDKNVILLYLKAFPENVYINSVNSFSYRIIYRNIKFSHF